MLGYSEGLSIGLKLPNLYRWTVKGSQNHGVITIAWIEPRTLSPVSFISFCTTSQTLSV